MQIIAITGGIGSGKSTVARWIEETGVPVVDADSISRKLTAENGQALPKLREAFGSAIFHADGTLNRAVLAALVFTNDPEPREKLNAILHPMIIGFMQRKLKTLGRKGVRVAVIDVPLLYETGMQHMADKVICVTASEETRVRRIMERDGVTQAQAMARVRAQQDPKITEQMADYVLTTDDSLEENRRNALQLWQYILGESEE